MPSEYTRREVERNMMRRVYRDLCAPGDHHPDCGGCAFRCPHTEGNDA